MQCVHRFRKRGARLRSGGHVYSPRYEWHCRGFSLGIDHQHAHQKQWALARACGHVLKKRVFAKSANARHGWVIDAPSAWLSLELLCFHRTVLRFARRRHTVLGLFLCGQCEEIFWLLVGISEILLKMLDNYTNQTQKTFSGDTSLKKWGSTPSNKKSWTTKNPTEINAKQNCQIDFHLESEVLKIIPSTAY